MGEWLNSVLLRLRALLRGQRHERDIDEELSFHEAMREDEYRRSGLDPEAARSRTRARFGRLERIREECLQVWSLGPLDRLRLDASSAIRRLRRDPAFTVVVVLTLALSISVASAVFAVVNGVLLKPLPYREPDRLVRLMKHMTHARGAGPTGRMPVSLNQKEREQLLSGSATLTHGGAAEAVFAKWIGYEPRFHGARTTASTFRMLGSNTLLGRVLDEADEASGASPAIVLREAAWRRFFGADENVLGQTVTLEAALGDPLPTVYTVIGVMPDSFAFPSRQAQFWTPFPVSGPNGASGGARGPFIARLAEGVSIEAAESKIAPIVRELQGGAAGPAAVTYELVGELDEIVSPVRRALLMLTGAVACLLLIACVNVVNLLLARGVRRQREIAIRSSLGAGRGHIVRLVFAESLVLAGLGGVAGTILATGGVRLFRTLTTTSYRVDLGPSGTSIFPRLDMMAVDGSVLSFTVAVCVIVATLFGLVTATYHTRRGAVDMLRRGLGASGRGLDSIGHLRVGGAFVIAEVALALVLLICSALLINSFAKLSQVDPGYDPTQVLTFQVSLPAEDYSGPRERQYADALVMRLGMIPGVQAAAYANQVPMVVLKDTARLYRTPDPARKPAPGGADMRLVSRDYMRVMRIETVSGRGLQEGDTTDAPRVMLINESLAREEFASADPVGQLVYLGSSPAAWEIVGVVSDVRQFGLDRAAEPQFFVDARQWEEGQGAPLFPIGAYYAVRLARDAAGALAGLDRIVRGIEPRAIAFNIAPMEQLISTTISRPYLYAVLMGVFSAFGLALAVTGIYGVSTYDVSQRTREFGIRLAIGAQGGDVLSLVLRQSLTLALAGIAIGAVMALIGTRYLEGLLFGITQLDVPTYLAVSLLFALVATLASYVPARRATQVDPVLALRDE